MPFGNPFDQYYADILKPAITEINFQILRADEIYSNRPIIDDIIERIIISDIIVADVSGKNPNVNYELGLAHALRKQAIIISQQLGDIPFDYRHIRTIIYDVSKLNWNATLKRDLQETIKTILKEEFEKFEIKSLDKFYQEISTKKLLGLQGIFSSRQSMNIYLDKLWEKPIKQLDIVAFGLKSFRDYRTDAIIHKVKEGMKIRLLTIKPFSDFLRQRERDEKLVENSIRKTILDLIKWRNYITGETKLTEAIEMKFYDSLPLDFFWKQDNNVFVGPYLHGIDSQQTITYQFLKKSKIGNFYSNYFEGLWKDSNFCNSSNEFDTL